jgi:hypothetical protein
VLAGAETVVDIALFGRKRLALLRRFCRFENGTPAHDHLGDILAVLDAEQFQRCFVAWVAALTGAPEGVIAPDGLPQRGPGARRCIGGWRRSIGPRREHVAKAAHWQRDVVKPPAADSASPPSLFLDAARRSLHQQLGVAGNLKTQKNDAQWPVIN